MQWLVGVNQVLRSSGATMLVPGYFAICHMEIAKETTSHENLRWDPLCYQEHVVEVNA